VEKSKRLLLVLAVLVLATSGVAAATLHVPGDYSSVLEAVDATAPGDTVLIGPGRWTHRDTRVVLIGGIPKTFTCCAFLKGGITLIGEAGAAATTIDAEAAGSGYVVTFLFANFIGEEVALHGLTITGAGNLGCAVGGDNSGRLTIRCCRVVDNTVLGEGTAILLGNCDLLLEDSEVSFNISTTWAGVKGFLSDMEVVRCRFEGNEGTALRNSDAETVIEDCEFLENRDITTGGVVLRSQDSFRVERCLFLRNVTTDGPGGGMSVTDSNGRVAFNTFAYDSTYGGWEGGGLATVRFTGEILGNTFVGCHNDAPYHGSAVSIHSNTSVTFRNNIIAESTGGYSIRLLGDLQFDHGCNDLWNNETGNGGYPVDATDLLVNPFFCDVPNLDFTLHEDSPCAAANNPTCGQIGAFGVGCGPVSLESLSWGRIKGLYR
jgi:hypothetical protein